MNDTPSFFFFEKRLFKVSSLVAPLPRPLSFLESTSSQASFLVLIFSKKRFFIG
jgi:hypothetical protein